MKRLLLIAFASIFLAACFHDTAGLQSPLAPTPSPTPEEMQIATVRLDEQNNSGQSGTATLEETAEGVVITLIVTAGPDATPQPAHIHVGQCPNPGAIEYPLANVVFGESTTTLDTDLETLAAQTADTGLAINIHQSSRRADIYVACGDLQP